MQIKSRGTTSVQSKAAANPMVLRAV